MAFIRVNQFFGTNKRIARTSLPSGFAVYAANCRMDSSAIEPLRAPRLEKQLGAGYKSFVNFEDEWIGFTERTDTTVFGGLLIYGSGGSVMVRNEGAEYKLGLPRPAAALPQENINIVQEGAGDPIDTIFAYAYVGTVGTYQFHSDLSPPTDTQSIKPTSTVIITAPPIPQGTGELLDGYTTAKIQFYRATTGGFFRVGDPLDAGQTLTITDSTENGAAALVEGYAMAPEGAMGFINVNSQYIACYKDRELIFSDIQIPHIYPEAYRYQLSEKITGLAFFRSTLFIFTEKNVFYNTTANPSVAPILATAGNISPKIEGGRIAVMDTAILYQSRDGIINALTGQNITKAVLPQADFPNLPMQCFEGHDGIFVGLFGRSGIIWDGAYLTYYESISTVIDSWQAENNVGYYMLDNGDIYEFGGMSERMVATWRSGDIQLPFPASFSAIEVRGELKEQDDYTEEQEHNAGTDNIWLGGRPAGSPNVWNRAIGLGYWSWKRHPQRNTISQLRLFNAGGQLNISETGYVDLTKSDFYGKPIIFRDTSTGIRDLSVELKTNVTISSFGIATNTNELSNFPP